MKNRKIKWDLIIIIILIFICIITLGISICHIKIWKNNSDDTDKQVDKLQQSTEIEIVEDSEDTEIIEQEEEIPEFNPYWDYINTNLINVNFDELKQINNSVVGWIKVAGTNINYPFVQASDNKYYLNHSFDGSYNSAGWVFLDYRNNKDVLAKNNIIYAHGRRDNTMFGSLRNIITNGWLNNTNNFIIQISTETQNTLWQVFSVYRIPTTNDYIQIDFKTNSEFLNFANKLISRSNHNFNTSVGENDVILTLSTCYDDNDKVALHAKLIKIEKK